MGIVVGWIAAMMVLVTGSVAAQETGTEESSAEETRTWSFESIFDGSNSWGDLRFAFGADAVQLDWDGITLGVEASQGVRHLADGAMSGEKDGTVTQEEMDDFTVALTALLEREFGKWANNRAFSGFVLIDQAEAQDAEVTRLEATGMTGPVDSEQLVTAGFGVHIDFPNVDDYKDIHTVRVNLGEYYIVESEEGQAESFAGDLTLRLSGMEGWTIDPDSVSPECASAGYSDGELVYEGEDASCFTGKSGVVLAFAITGAGKESTNFLPSLQVLGAISALGFAALRRRF